MIQMVQGEYGGLVEKRLELDRVESHEFCNSERASEEANRNDLKQRNTRVG